MKKWLQLLFLLPFLITFAQSETDSASLPNTARKERIISFHSDIEVDKNSGVTVTEHIKAYSEGNKIKRGIFRSLPLSRNLNNRRHKVRYEIVSVKKNGADEDYHEKIVNDYLEIYFGNENIILEPGTYDYEIKYKAKNQIGFFDRYDELYWNVNGTFWDFDVDSISARVTLPGGGIIQNSCYTGAYGSTAQNCTAKILSDNSIEWSASGLKANEGLTVAVGFKKGIMVPPPPPTFMELYGILIAGFIIFIGLIIYYYTTWKKYGVDPETPTVYPQFNVPENMSPATLGYIKSESFSSKYLTAAIVELAIKGYIKIIESEESGILGFFNKKNFTLKKLKEADETLPKEEINLMNSLFTEYKDAVTFDGKYDSKIEKAVLNFKETLKFQHDNLLDEGNNTTKLLLPWLVITVVYGIGLGLSYTVYPEIEKVLVGGVMYIVLFVLFIVATFLKKKFFWIFMILIPFNMLFGISVMIYTGYEAVESINFNVCYLFLVLSFVSLVIYQRLIKRPSEEKLRKKSLIDGFKMYMGAAENEQLKFHNPPQMTPQVFETLLPFAMVLGVDEIWGKKFDEVLKQTSADYQNTWYYGGTMNHYAFASTLNSSLTQSIQSTSTQASSSGSGSGGGGFSGGGGGGGGGGGW
ncbi:MAG: DUF2207 domain-containing protein [Chryseobacterium sp.]|jgi:uncharacterized membrane protein YgcG|uniref:DUF2207 domain-containing protein n=1 Tax=Chryseobacterium sp. TaxID=1871047 RepID=UPI00281F2CA8|nr:DUF2207 domain-containing protein [Chryseobacterium sp.]MDR2234907.1 DUF2207 domain-containing protein [Chryseobacterium sp.]